MGYDKMLTVEQDVVLLEALETRWMMGQNGSFSANELPEQWRCLIERLPGERQDLAVLALWSQQNSFLFVPKPARELTAKPPLPAINYPVLEDDLRPLFKRSLVAIKKQFGIGQGHLLQLLLLRNRIAHPADWLPDSQTDDLPDIYWPWCRWVASELNSRSPEEELCENNWDDYFPAERLARLREMRMREPQRALALIQACAGREPAEKRLKIIEILAIGLSDADAEFLQTLTNDRSQKISQLVIQFLARLGVNNPRQDEDNTASELAAGFEIKKSGLLKKTRYLVPLQLKSNKQKSIRSELLLSVPVQDFASALQVDLVDLLQIWQFSANRDHDNFNFVSNAMSTLSDNHLQLLLANLLGSKTEELNILPLVRLLVPRLNPGQRAELMHKLLRQSNVNFSFSDCLVFIDEPMSEFDWAALTRTRAWGELNKSLQKDAGKGYLDDYNSVKELMALGLLLPRVLARQLLETIVGMGISQADPVLDTIKLNIQLEDNL